MCYASCYGDVHIINGKGCLIMGAGKSKAARIATDRCDECEIMVDFSSIENRDGVIYYKGSDIEINYFIFCLNKDETSEYYGSKIHEIVEVSNEVFLDKAKESIDMGNDALTKIKAVKGEDVKQSMDHFVDVTKNSSIHYLLVPFMNSVEEKAEQYIKYIK